LLLRFKVTFDDDTETAQEQKIEAESNAITQALRKSERALKAVVEVGGAEADERVRKNIQVALAKKLQERSTKFRNMQKEYMQKLQKQKTGASGSSELDFLNESAGGGGGARRGKSMQAISVGFTQQQLQVISFIFFQCIFNCRFVCATNVF
jgi:hypothetical protein